MNTIGLVLVMLTLAGCTTTGVLQAGERGYRWTETKTILNEQIQPVIGTFFSKECPRTMTPDHKEWIVKPCEQVTLYTNPPGEEAYSYVFKIKIKSTAGIPYGEQPVQIYVVGDRRNCLEVSEAHNHRPDGSINEGNMRLSTDPTERCVGPVFLR
jgi:hypothetical protein